ncbi:MAG: hypothetical protein K1060chlam5_00643 [Candidatus Anoxychlamydiales bacterium]|nr:hypothetical protein [Candidatus Anoxychlamydiales bacterium]
MNPSVLKYYNDKSFEDVIIFDKEKMDFEKAKSLCFSFPKAWAELCQINKDLRIEFYRDYLLKILPYKPNVYSFIYDFFSYLENLDVVFFKKNKTDNYECELVYSLKDIDTFFRGKEPLEEIEIKNINASFEMLLPRDYLTFLKVHKSFSKNDDTGVFDGRILKDMQNEFINFVENKNSQIRSDSFFIDPKTLIPFYQCYNKESFQCFFTQWFPIEEMGNVYYSGLDNQISDYHNMLNSSETLSFKSFLDWLIFYMDVFSL